MAENPRGIPSGREFLVVLSLQFCSTLRRVILILHRWLLLADFYITAPNIPVKQTSSHVHCRVHGEFLVLLMFVPYPTRPLPAFLISDMPTRDSTKGEITKRSPALFKKLGVVGVALDLHI